MPFMPANCPTCSGHLQLPDDQIVVSCMYCGNDILVHQAIKTFPQADTANYFTLAEAANHSGNTLEAYNYYTKILEIDPNNPKAWIGKSEAAGWLSTLSDIRIYEMLSGFERAITLLEEDNRQNEITYIVGSINNISMAYHTLARKHLEDFVTLEGVWVEYLEQCNLIIAALETAHALDPSDLNTMENIIYLCIDNLEGIKFEDIYQGNIRTVLHASGGHSQNLFNLMQIYEKKIHLINPSYVLPTINRQTVSSCFIATATMGNTNHPDVEILRNFRDRYLHHHSYGLIFVKYYYLYSPPLAKIISTRVFFKKVSYTFLIRPLASIARYQLAKRTD